jgi:hypothetical protein
MPGIGTSVADGGQANARRRLPPVRAPTESGRTSATIGLAGFRASPLTPWESARGRPQDASRSQKGFDLIEDRESERLVAKDADANSHLSQ